MSEFSIQVAIEGDTGTLMWADQVDLDTLSQAVSLAADDVLIGHELRRVEVRISDRDLIARRALHQAGFRQEGRLRQALAADGEFHDVLLYARLATDTVYGAAGFSAVMDSVLPTKRIIGHVVFRDAENRVLLLKTSYKTDLELPGGIVEPGESPVDGARREVLEELGLDVELGEPVLVDWMPPFLGWGDAIEFIYDAGVMTEAQQASIVLGEPEIAGMQWTHPSELTDEVSPLQARRLRLLEHPRARVVFTHDGRL